MLKKKKQEAEQLQVEYNEATGAANVQAEEKPVSTKSIDEMEAEEKKKAEFADNNFWKPPDNDYDIDDLMEDMAN